MNLLDELQEHVVCGDGAMGTLLLDQGLPMESCLEEVCVSDPDRVRAIHRDYIAAGARVIETNTFGANGVRLSRFGFENRVSEFNRAAAKLAKEGAKRGALSPGAAPKQSPLRTLIPPASGTPNPPPPAR